MSASQASATKNAVTPGVVPVKLVMRRPRAILKVDQLMSRKGIAALPGVIKEARFKGKGHELADLRLLLSKSKHWAHRLFPSSTFEDFVEKAEQLGNKKQLKNFLMKVRRGMPLNLDPDEVVVQSDNDSDHEPDLPPISENQQQPKESELAFDRLFKDHIDEMKDKNSGGVDGNESTLFAASTKITVSQTSTTTKPKQPQPSMEDFMMDDDDDFDDDFLASFKP